MKILNNKKKKPTFIETKEDVIQIYKELTRRKCYRMDIAENESPEILDSKLLGVPYLPNALVNILLKFSYYFLKYYQLQLDFLHKIVANS